METSAFNHSPYVIGYIVFAIPFLAGAIFYWCMVKKIVAESHSKKTVQS